MFELKTLDDYSDDALLQEIKRVAVAIDGQRLTQQKFLEHSKVHVTTVRRRFGSWQKALDLAGIDEKVAPRYMQLSRDAVLEAISLHAQEFPGDSPTLESIAQRMQVHKTTLAGKFGAWQDLLREVGLDPVPLGRRYTDDECFENIVALWTYYGHQPNFAELNQAPSTVGSKAYVRRWGGWRAALSAFIKHVNQPSPAASQTLPIQSPQKPAESAPASAPRSISLSLRYKVLCRDHFRCVICGRSPAKDHSIELHIDHIIPWSKGGQNVEENLRALCLDCNLGKGDKTEGA
jgi:transposase